MPLSSQGCNATIWEVYACTPTYQRVKLYTYKKNPITSSKQYSIDFSEVCYLRNNTTLVKKGDTIRINDFYIQSCYSEAKGRTLYVNITDWELRDKNDYSKLNVEYKGAEYDGEE